MKFAYTQSALHVKCVVLSYDFKHNFEVLVQLPYTKFNTNVFSDS
jgi:hypothetical protein